MNRPRRKTHRGGELRPIASASSNSPQRRRFTKKGIFTLLPTPVASELSSVDTSEPETADSEVLELTVQVRRTYSKHHTFNFIALRPAPLDLLWVGVASFRVFAKKSPPRSILSYLFLPSFRIAFGMAARKALSTFVNRNPRNLEMLNLFPKPTGYPLEKDRDMKNFIYKAVLIASKGNTEAHVIHHRNGVVLSASTREKAIADQLYSTVDTCAATNIGRVLADRCRKAGILYMIPDSKPEVIERSQKQKAFFETLATEGINLYERDHIKHTFDNDPNLTWLPYEQQHNRQDKLDELF
uniref:Large ribosomal subunit protein uL18m n=1 Tax=Steinernema glaseri TaxID=37863 RepID=A0A1I7YZI4_9BILA